jgi:hypothetical protein
MVQASWVSPATTEVDPQGRRSSWRSMRGLKPAMAAAGTVIPGSEGVATRVFKSPGGKPLLVDFRPMGPLLLTRKIQSDSHIPGLFPHQFPGNSQRPKAAREHWRRRGACRMRSTSKTRQFDLDDRGPSQSNPEGLAVESLTTSCFPLP